MVRRLFLVSMFAAFLSAQFRNLSTTDDGSLLLFSSAISRAYFSRSYFYPEGMSFARSEALFPPGELAAAISAEYEGQCRLLCYGLYPSWAEIQARFEELRHLL